MTNDLNRQLKDHIQRSRLLPLPAHLSFFRVVDNILATLSFLDNILAKLSFLDNILATLSFSFTCESALCPSAALDLTDLTENVRTQRYTFCFWFREVKSAEGTLVIFMGQDGLGEAHQETPYMVLAHAFVDRVSFLPGPTAI